MDSAMADWGMPKYSASAAPAQGELYACDSLAEFAVKFQNLFDNATNPLIPAFFSFQLAIGSQATFDITLEVPSTLPAAQLDADPSRSDVANNIVNDSPLPKKRRKLEPSSARTENQTMSVVEVVNSQPEKKPLPIQRAAAKSIMAVVTEIDGFGWQGHNTTRNKDGWRLEYVCNDSYQNKTRAGNKTRREEASDDVKEHRQASRKQRQGYHDKKPPTAAIDSSAAVDRIRPAGAETHDNPLQAPKHRHGYGYPSSTLNPLHHTGSDNGSVAVGSSSRHSSPNNSQYGTLTPNPLKNPNTMSMVTVVNQHQRSASIDFSFKRSRALSLLAAAGINAGSLSEYQLQVLQDQDPEMQKNSLQLFQDYGPSQLMIVAQDVAGSGNLMNANAIRSTPPNSLQGSSYPTVPQFAGYSNGGMPNVRIGLVPNSSSRMQSSPVPNPYISDESRRSSSVSHTEVGSSGDRNGAQSITSRQVTAHANEGAAGNLDRNTSATTELTANGTPKQPGVFEFSSKSAEESKSEASSGRGKYPRTKKSVVTGEKSKTGSQTGCKTCGKRRKKCDGGHPVCNNCKKDGKDCVYVSAPAVSSSPGRRSAWDKAKEAVGQESSAPHAFQPIVDMPADEENDAWLQDLIAASMGVDGT